jgi:OOP family OmpA-OmpF porin
VKIKIFALALLSALTAPVFAENMYASLALGSAFDDDLSGFAQTSTGMSYSLMFGYKINKNFAAEIGYTSLLSTASVANTVATTETANGYEVAGVGTYPINEQISAFGRLGYTSLNQNYVLNTAVGSIESLSGFVYGLGAQYDINKIIGLRVGYNIYNTQGSRGSSIISNTNISALYAF